MPRKSAFLFLSLLVLTACASDRPRIVQPATGAEEIRLTSGIATQIEMPASERVQSVVTGNPALVTAERGDGVVNLIPRENSGETNLIVRAVDEDGEAKVYQYRIVVQGR